MFNGKTKRRIKIRFLEHFSHIKYNRPDKSAVANQCLTMGHTILNSNLKGSKKL